MPRKGRRNRSRGKSPAKLSPASLGINVPTLDVGSGDDNPLGGGQQRTDKGLFIIPKSPVNSPRANGSSSPAHTPRFFGASKKSPWAKEASSSPYKAMWVQPGLSFKDILLGKRSDFEAEKKKLEQSPMPQTPPKKESNANTVSDMPSAPRASKSKERSYRVKLLKQFKETKEGYERLQHYNDTLRRRKKRQEDYVVKLNEAKLHMEKVLRGEAKPPSETETVDQRLPENLNANGDGEGIRSSSDKLGNEATQAAEKALEILRAEAEKAKEESERRRADVNRMHRRLEGLKRALKTEEDLRKKEAEDGQKRSEESKQLAKQVNELRNRLNQQAEKRKEAEQNAMEAKRKLVENEKKVQEDRLRLTKEQERKTKELQSTQQLELNILSMQSKIQKALEEKERIKKEADESTRNATVLRSQIGDLHSSLAEQKLARHKAERKAEELTSNFEAKVENLKEELEKEKRQKQEAEKEAKLKLIESAKLKEEVYKMENILRQSEIASKRAIEERRAAHLEAQQEAEAARAAANAVLEATRLKEEEAKRREEQLQEKANLAQEEAEKLKEKKKAEIEAKEKDLRDAMQKLEEMRLHVQKLEEKRRKDEEKRRALHNRVQDLLGHVRVYCRIRPIGTAAGKETKSIDFESRMDDGISVLEVKEKSKSSSRWGGKQRTKKHLFTFDRVFGTNSQQPDVFGDIQPLITSSMDGFDVTLFAYGQTGSGKTFTMFGPPEVDLSSAEVRGIIPRSIDHIFKTIEDAKERKWSYTLSASILEIYNESVYDLLATTKPSSSKKKPIKSAKSSRQKTPMKGTNKSESKVGLELKISKDQTRVECVGLTKVPVNNPQQLHELTTSAAEKATRAATDMNARSSRSHTIFQLHIDGKHEDANTVVKSMLTLVDLAGSERIAKTGAEGARLEEAKKINQSLSLLGQCVRALAEKSKHVPYRSSKLTYLLHKALSGTGKTAVIVNITPAEISSGETMCTLRFADKLKDITNV